MRSPTPRASTRPRRTSASCAIGCCERASSAHRAAPADRAKRPVPSFREHVDTLERWRRFPGLERVDPPSDAAALTFDDGPDPDATPAVLAALEAEGVRATFFLVGEQLVLHHELGREIAERGHEPALHGFAHRSHDAFTPGGA